VPSDRRRKEASEWNEGIAKRLDAIIRILLRQTEVQEMSARGQIQLLEELGLSDAEIARILGRSRGYVASELSKMRTGGKAHGK
jgi:DNA-binding CsgD family transcriptional regulator